MIYRLFHACVDLVCFLGRWALPLVGIWYFVSAEQFLAEERSGETVHQLSVDEVLAIPPKVQKFVSIRDGKIDVAKKFQNSTRSGSYYPVDGDRGIVYLFVRDDDMFDDSKPVQGRITDLYSPLSSLRFAVRAVEGHEAYETKREKFMRAGEPDRRFVLIEQSQPSEGREPDEIDDEHANRLRLFGGGALVLAAFFHGIHWIGSRYVANNPPIPGPVSGNCEACGAIRPLGAVAVTFGGMRRAGLRHARVVGGGDVIVACEKCFRRLAGLTWLKYGIFVSTIVLSVVGVILGREIGLYALGLAILVIGIAIFVFVYEFALPSSVKSALKQRNRVLTLTALDHVSAERTSFPPPQKLE